MSFELLKQQITVLKDVVSKMNPQQKKEFALFVIAIFQDVLKE